MLTRLHIQGFKNLADTEVRLGPFTCIAGVNGIGKSNLFDALRFLGDLCEFNFVEAAHRVRGADKASKLSRLFGRRTDGTWRDIRIEADFFVPQEALDDFGQQTKPSVTFLNYSVGLRYLAGDSSQTQGDRIQLLEERLVYIPKSKAQDRIGFPYSTAFIESLRNDGARTAPFISTTDQDPDAITIHLHQDQTKGRYSSIPAKNSPRTVLSTIKSDEYPTALVAKRAMQSWQQLQLEPSQLREPDGFELNQDHIDSRGAHLPATLARLGATDEVTNTLAQLIPEVKSLEVDIDDARQTRVLYLTQHDGTRHAARELSDGTLRFLALATLKCDPQVQGVICLEEPENGIHPGRIPAMIELLQHMAVDTNYAVDSDNPLRQVIINTHSPLVVESLYETAPDTLLLAVRLQHQGQQVTSFAHVKTQGLTWRSKIAPAGLVVQPVGKSLLIDFLEDHESRSKSRYLTQNSTYTLL
jgi:predicted ATPase